MSMRFYAACAVMNGLLADIKTSKSIELDAERIMKDSYVIADELLRQENL